MHETVLAAIKAIQSLLDDNHISIQSQHVIGFERQKNAKINIEKPLATITSQVNNR